MANKITADIEARGADKTARDLKKVGDSAAAAGDQLEDLGKDSKQTGVEVDGLTKKTKESTDSFTDMAKEAGFVGREVERLKANITSLTKQLDATGDTSLLKDIRKERRQLGTFTKLSAGLGGTAADAAAAGTSFGTKFMEGAATGIKAGGPYAIAALAVVAASAVPFVGSAIGAAVLGGVGAGGLIGGITLAAKDPRVKAAGTEFAESAMSDLQANIGSAFVGPTVAALGQLQGTVGDIARGLAPEMQELSKEIGPLTRGLDALGRNALPGLNAGLDAAAPLMRTVSMHLPKIGTALSGALEDIASGGDGANRALDITLTKVEDLIEVTGEFVGWAGRTYDELATFGEGVTGDFEDILGVVGKISPFFSFLADEVAQTNDELEGSAITLKKSKESVEEFGVSVDGIAISAEEAAEKLDAMHNSMNKLLGITMGAKEATLGYEQAIDDLAAELADGAKTFDQGTEAGRRNWEAVNNNIDAINDLRDANIANGMSIADANVIADAQLGKLDATVAKFGKASTEVRAFIAEIRNIPTLTQLRIEVSGLAGIIAQLKALKGLLGSNVAAANAVSGEYISGRASGGPIKAGVPYIVGEQGPELIVPSQNGMVHNAGATAAMMSGSSGGSAGTQVIEHHHTITITSASLLTGIREVVLLGGGNVQKVLGTG